MKESMEDRIIERYLNGEMRPDEERDFRALLEIDPELRRRMDAEKIVQQALEHDLAALQHEESGSYSKFLAALATSVPAAEGVLGGGAASSTTGSAAGSAGGSAGGSLAGSVAAGTATGGSLSGGFFSSLLAGGVAQGLTVVALVATMATGVYIATPSAEPARDSAPAAIGTPAGTAEQNPRGLADSSDAGMPAMQQEIATPGQIATPAPTAVAGDKIETAERGSTTDMTDRSGREHASDRRPAATSQHVEAPAGTRENDLDAVLKSMEKDASRQIDVIESDSTTTAVKIGTKKGTKKKTE